MSGAVLAACAQMMKRRRAPAVANCGLANHAPAPAPAPAPTSDPLPPAPRPIQQGSVTSQAVPVSNNIVDACGFHFKAFKGALSDVEEVVAGWPQHHLPPPQAEEHKRRKKLEVANKELQKRAAWLRSLEVKYGPYSMPDSGSRNKQGPVEEKRMKVEMLKAKVDEEKANFELVYNQAKNMDAEQGAKRRSGRIPSMRLAGSSHLRGDRIYADISILVSEATPKPKLKPNAKPKRNT
ncbi:hypothetical protein Cgig2_019577 [Carnegiea gigantea]|uniref:Uncharacterized protein n=1 Tax=Carnegiea gigantea TaxID=171969 RepID=A0A9Q1QKN0_9CARY|nr:hypothetical protein Cgig2_019577 [Carnegiea gigantea]